MEGGVDGDLPIGKRVDGDGEIHARIARIYIFEEVFGPAQFGKEIRKIEGPEHMAFGIEARFRRRDMAIAEMWPVIEQMVKNHLWKTDGLVKGVETAVGGIGGSFQLPPGQRSHLVMAVIDPFPGQPALFVTADATRAQEVRMRGLRSYWRDRMPCRIEIAYACRLLHRKRPRCCRARNIV